MQTGYLDICGVPTKIITYGKWVEDGFSKDEPKDIVLLIPGNPGVTEFYCKFLEIIHERLGYPVWIVGHAGHEQPKNNSHGIPPLENNEKLYSLHGQIMHKQAFMDRYVPKDARIHFIGHSLGTYIVLQLLKDPKIEAQTMGNYFLFPVFERLIETKNGKFLSNPPLIARILLTVFILFFSMLPITIQSFLIRCYMKCFSVPTWLAESILNLLQPNTFGHWKYFGLDAITSIKERDNDVLVRNKNKIKLYYGVGDSWTPLSFYEQLKDDIPGIDAQVCKRNIGHAFVFKHSEEVGEMVADWIKQ